jgi:hypothetical protein
VVGCSPFDSRFVGSNPVEDDEIFKGHKIRSTISFETEVKPSAPCRKLLRHVKEQHKYKRDTS